MGKVKVSDNRFSTDITIPCYDTDASFHLKPAAFMDHAQEMAYLAAQALHFGYDDLQKHHTAWVLSRLVIEMEEMPTTGEHYVIETWVNRIYRQFTDRTPPPPPASSPSPIPRRERSTAMPSAPGH